MSAPFDYVLAEHFDDIDDVAFAKLTVELALACQGVCVGSVVRPRTAEENQRLREIAQQLGVKP